MCFLRHLSEEEAMATLDASLEHRHMFMGVGLDSSELGHPPEKFERVFARCRKMGLHVVAHAGEEGPPAYIESALNALGAERIDHGVQAEKSPALMQRLAQQRTPLTVCPLSNLKLCVIPDLRQHNLRRLLEAGLCVSIHSDDPAYFGGYILENFVQTFEALNLGPEHALQLARNSFEASFVDPSLRDHWLSQLDACHQNWLQHG
jgi:adenosine deaminase